MKDKELSGELKSAFDADPPSHVSQAAVQRHRMRVRRRLLVFSSAAATLVVAASIGVFNLGFSRESATISSASPADTSSSRNFISLNTDPSVPCSGARALPLRTLVSKTTTPIWLPPEGSEDLTASYLCGLSPYLQFENFALSYEGGWRGADPATHYAGLAAQNGGVVQKLTNGMSVYLSAADQFPSMALVMNGDTQVRAVGGEDVSPAQLQNVLDSLNFSSPAN